MSNPFVSRDGLVRACNEMMESGRHKFFNADLHGAREDFSTAAEIFPECEPNLRCCAVLSFMCGDKSAACDYDNKADHNRDREHSDIQVNVFQDVWAGFMNWIIIRPLKGEDMEVRHQEVLPALPSSFQRMVGVQPAGLLAEAANEAPEIKQELCLVLLFTPIVERVGNEVRVTLSLKKAEFVVSNFLYTKDFQGYFVHELEIRARPNLLWLSSCDLISVSPGAGSNVQPVQDQQISAYGLGVGVSGITPAANAAYAYTDAILTSSLPHQMISTKAGKEWRSFWKVERYEGGEKFGVRSDWNVHKLPYNPDGPYVCSDSGEFKGTWKVTSDVARMLHYCFEWHITLQAKLALLPRRRKRDKLLLHLNLAREPQLKVVTRESNLMSDFTITWRDQLQT